MAGKLNASADEYDRGTTTTTDSFTLLDETPATTSSRISAALDESA